MTSPGARAAEVGKDYTKKNTYNNADIPNIKREINSNKPINLNELMQLMQSIKQNKLPKRKDTKKAMR